MQEKSQLSPSVTGDLLQQAGDSEINTLKVKSELSAALISRDSLKQEVNISLWNGEYPHLSILLYACLVYSWCHERDKMELCRGR